MAQKVEILLVDDIDQSEASQTIEFGVDGVQYAIDLNDAHADELRGTLARYVDSARRTGGRKSSGKRTGASGGARVGTVQRL